MTGFFDIYTYALPLFDNSISTPTYTFFNSIDTFNKLGYKAKINTHTTSYIN